MDSHRHLTQAEKEQLARQCAIDECTPAEVEARTKGRGVGFNWMMARVLVLTLEARSAM